MLISRLPQPALRPFVKRLWVAVPATGQPAVTGAREHVLPTGGMHLVFRLSDAPLRLFQCPDDPIGRVLGHAVVGGARSTFYVRDVSTPSSSVGAQLYPGAAQVLFGITADALSERHTRLEDLWGPAAAVARERLLEADGPERKLALFETLLLARFPPTHGLHPAVAHAIQRLAETNNVHEVVKQSGYSHRHFIALFRRAVGLSPKTYGRLLRFQKALECVAHVAHVADVDMRGTISWADLALDCGYSDQAHFNREFREFTGVTPENYREISPVFAHHLSIDLIQ
ncbi:MAG: helix-turn-helix transcriptional regulator [Candidatus Manganitrophaceae bacterium]